MDRASGLEVQLRHYRTIPGVYTGYVYLNVNFVFWFGPATLESCALLDEDGRKRAAEHPEGLSSINVMVPGGRGLPEAAARAELARIMHDHGKSTAAVAVIIPGSGFFVSAMRSLIAALSMVRPQGMPLQTFGDAAQLSEWLAPIHSERTGVPLTAAELLSLFQQAERALAETAAA
jgi:hypothetical protein